MSVLSSARVSELARAAGFDLCGFARADPIPPEVLGNWLEAGLDADMDWMGDCAAERLDPSLLLPGARSVVALACNYFHPDEPGVDSPIARYARGRDYHYTLKDRLRSFRRALDAEHPGLGSYGSVDSGPLMEKVWAARAGLGYVGRNGCLITEPFGSYVLLSALILDRDIDRYADGPEVDRCGACSLCVSACPTEAILPDSQVDAGRCLSYQTIENQAEVPEALREAFAGIAFGCDICQDVCPLNLHPIAGGDRFLPRPLAGLTVRQLAALSPAAHQALIPGSALARAKYDGLRRNAVYALGAARDEGARELLTQLCGDSSERVRSAAQWAISRLSK